MRIFVAATSTCSVRNTLTISKIFRICLRTANSRFLRSSDDRKKSDILKEALGDFLHHYRAELGVEIEVDASAQCEEQQNKGKQ